MQTHQRLRATPIDRFQFHRKTFFYILIKAEVSCVVLSNNKFFKLQKFGNKIFEEEERAVSDLDQGILKGESIIVPLTSCLTGLESAV
jgi:hypothetical protein